jgi:DNA-binding transcriptional ArsR family regulator
MVKYSEDELDSVFSALSHPTRRAILGRLSRNGATVGELAEPFDLSPPAISRHLRVLESAGLLQRRVDGRIHRIGLAPGPLQEAAQWLEEHRRFWEPRLDALVRYVEETTKEEEATWKPRKSARTSRSGSSGRSPRRPTRSSRHGHGPKR